MSLRVIALAALAAFSLSAAEAAPIAWNTWSSTSAGSIATGSGTVGVTFSGNAFGRLVDYPSYAPGTTWADGSVVSNGPVAANGILQLAGGSTALQTVAFSQAVVNPVFSIWSLGQSGLTASFVFQGATPVFVSGGPSAEYGGSPIVVAGNTVSGTEGNGTVEFIGTYTSLSWTNPQYEFWYGFDVGVAGVAAPVPEPETYALMLGGLAAVAEQRRRRRARR